MSDVAEDIRKATEQVRAQRPTLAAPPTDAEAAFRKLRAHVRGVMIDAHRALTQRQGAWAEGDDRLIDVVSTWLEDVRGRP
jgi:hypothetical protein